jgi:hypothetical protein
MLKKPIFLGIVILIVGLIFGALVSSFFISDRRDGHSPNGRKISKEHFKKRMIRVIDPDEDQFDKIDPIIDKYAERTSEITDKYFEEFSTILDSMRIELEPILTDKQKERLRERRDKMEKFKFRKNKKKWKRNSE